MLGMFGILGNPTSSALSQGGGKQAIVLSHKPIHAPRAVVRSAVVHEELLRNNFLRARPLKVLGTLANQDESSKQLRINCLVCDAAKSGSKLETCKTPD
jgi:hypothetical protein